jgi:ligand-binding SRPBCC domain-containing protein
MTEITHVIRPVPAPGGTDPGDDPEGCYFVDEQRRGPYRLWHHQHHFKEISGGAEMTDIVHYQLPLAWIGERAHALFVRRRVEGIFKYRFQRVEERFGHFTGEAAGGH